MSKIIPRSCRWCGHVFPIDTHWNRDYCGDNCRILGWALEKTGVRIDTGLVYVVRSPDDDLTVFLVEEAAQRYAELFAGATVLEQQPIVLGDYVGQCAAEMDPVPA